LSCKALSVKNEIITDHQKAIAEELNNFFVDSIQEIVCKNSKLHNPVFSNGTGQYNRISAGTWSSLNVGLLKKKLRPKAVEKDLRCQIS